MKIRWIVLAVAVVLLASGGLGVYLYAHTPENAVFSAVVDTFDDALARDEVAPMYHVLERGSIAVSIDELADEDYDLLEGGRISGKVYFSQKGLMIEGADVQYDDFALSGDLYVSDEMIYVNEEEIIKGAYGAKYADLADDFANSIFAYGSGSDYAIEDEEAYDAILRALESMDNSDMSKDAEKLVKRLVQDAWDIVCDNADFESKNKKVRLNDGKKKVRVITVTVDADALSDMLADLYDYLLEDEEIPEFFEKHGEVLFTETSGGGYYIGDMYFAHADSAVEAYKLFLEELEKEIDTLCDRIERSEYYKEIKLEFVMSRTSNTLLKLTVDSGDYEVLSVDFGSKGVKRTNEIAILVDGVEIEYTVEQNDRKGYEARLELDGDEIIKISVNRSKETFAIYFDVDGNGARLGGTFHTDFGKTELTVNKLMLYESYYSTSERDYVEETFDYAVDITLEIRERDRMPSAPVEYETIADIKDSDIEKWMERIEE